MSDPAEPTGPSGISLTMEEANTEYHYHRDAAIRCLRHVQEHMSERQLIDNRIENALANARTHVARSRGALLTMEKLVAEFLEGK